MKVFYICADVEIPVYGTEGSSIHIREFTNAMAAAGHDVTIFCPWLGGQRPADMRAPVRLIEPHGLDAEAWRAIEGDPFVQDHKLDRDLKSVLVNAWFQRQVAEMAAGNPPDLIYERHSLFGWSGLDLARRHGIPFILEVNAPIAQEQEEYDRFVLMRTSERIEEQILRGADALISVSAVAADWLVSRGVPRERVTVIPNAVSRALFERRADGARIRERFGLAGKRVVGFVGSFQLWHDVTSLIGAFDRVHARHPDIHLLLVGQGPLKDELAESAAARQLSESVTFADSVPHAEIPDYLDAMDIVTAPYPQWKKPFHGSPIKIFEYMAAGRPIVAAALGQIGDIIEHERTGLLYEPGDEQGLVNALERMLSDSAAAARMGAAARVEALSDYSWNAVVSKVLRIAQSLKRT